MTLRSNPRALVPVAVVAALVAGAVLVAALVQVVVGLVALLLTGYLAYRIVRFIIKHLASYVAADDDGVTICEFGEDTHHHPVGRGHLRRPGARRRRHRAAVCVRGAGRPADDRVARVRELRTAARRTGPPHPPTDLELAAGESLADHLRGLLPAEDSQDA